MIDYSLAKASPLLDSLKLPILQQAKLLTLGLSNNRDDIATSTTEKYAERLLVYPTPTSMALRKLDKVKRPAKAVSVSPAQTDGNFHHVTTQKTKKMVKISQIEKLLDKQTEFNKYTQDLRKLLRDCSEEDRDRIKAALDPSMSGHYSELVYKVTQLVRELGTSRKVIKDMANLGQEALSPFGDIEFLRNLFEIYQNKQGSLARVYFKKFTKHITLDDVPDRQYQDWWNFITWNKVADFNQVLVWYSHFIL
jgi:hypothetical protein